MEFVYLIKAADTDFFKIGYSKNPEQRLKNLQTANGTTLELIEKFKTSFGFKIEKFLHKNFCTKRKSGEWFQLNKEDLSKFREMCEKQDKKLIFLDKNNTYIQDRQRRF